LSGSVHTIKKNTETVVVASKDVGLKINYDKTRYVVIYRDQNAERIQNTKTVNKSLERVEQMQYLGTILTNQFSFRRN